MQYHLQPSLSKCTLWASLPQGFFVFVIMLAAGVPIHRVCKPLSLLGFTIIVMSGCLFYIFKALGKILNCEAITNTIGNNCEVSKFFSPLERWKPFCTFWSVLWLVRISNVLTPVRWHLFEYLTYQVFNC